MKRVLIIVLTIMICILMSVSAFDGVIFASSFEPVSYSGDTLGITQLDEDGYDIRLDYFRIYNNINDEYIDITDKFFLYGKQFYNDMFSMGGSIYINYSLGLWDFAGYNYTRLEYTCGQVSDSFTDWEYYNSGYFSLNIDLSLISEFRLVQLYEPLPSAPVIVTVDPAGGCFQWAGDSTEPYIFTVDEGTVLNKPNSMFREDNLLFKLGYEFTGWDIDVNIPLYENTVITAQWRKLSVGEVFLSNYAYVQTTVFSKIYPNGSVDSSSYLGGGNMEVRYYCEILASGNIQVSLRYRDILTDEWLVHAGYDFITPYLMKLYVLDIWEISEVPFNNSLAVWSFEVTPSDFSLQGYLFNIGLNAYLRVGTFEDIYNDGFNNGYEVGKEDGEVIGYDIGYTAGYNAGYSYGRGVGYEIGFSDGETIGYDLGFLDGETAGKDMGYNKGFLDGAKDGYNEGYAVGEADGYLLGHTAGMAEGYARGYEIGYELGQSGGAFENYNKGYLDGLEAGDSEGYTRGYKAGERAGLQAGYEAGYYDATNGESPFNQITLMQMIGDFFSILQIKIFGDVTLGTLLLVPVMFAVLMFVLKIVRG